MPSSLDLLAMNEDFESAANYVQTFVQIDAKYKDSGSDQAFIFLFEMI